MIGPTLVATSVKHVWAGAVIVVTVLVVAGCKLPVAEHTAKESNGGGASTDREPAPSARVVVRPTAVVEKELTTHCTGGSATYIMRLNASNDAALHRRVQVPGDARLPCCHCCLLPRPTGLKQA